MVSPKLGLRTDHANHIFYFFNTLCYGRCFVASDTLVLCYVFLLKLAAPAARRVSLVVSLESGVY